MLGQVNLGEAHPERLADLAGRTLVNDVPMKDLLLLAADLNLNDNTVEGMRHRKLPVFSVQYHPEAAPGPLDSSHLFHRFRELVRKQAGARR